MMKTQPDTAAETVGPIGELAALKREWPRRGSPFMIDALAATGPACGDEVERGDEQGDAREGDQHCQGRGDGGEVHALEPVALAAW